VNGEAHQFCCYGCCLAYRYTMAKQTNRKRRAVDSPRCWRISRHEHYAVQPPAYSGTFGEADAGWCIEFTGCYGSGHTLIVILGGPSSQARGRLQKVTRQRGYPRKYRCPAAYGYSGTRSARSGIVYFDTATMVLILFTLGRYLEAQAA